MRYVFDPKKKKFVEPKRDARRFHSVHPDFEEHGGRTRFRESLKRTGAIEMGRSDIAAATERWESKKASFADKAGSALGNGAAMVDAPAGEIQAVERSRVNAEIANRLDNRPTPGRKMLLKIALETAREFARRR